MKTKDLQELIDFKSKELRSLKEQLNDIENTKLIKQYKEKYEGKYFKYMNSYGSGYRWPIYSYCKEIKKSQGNICYTYYAFELKPKNGFEIERHRMSLTGEHLFQIEISKEEFKKAKDKYLRAILAVFK